MQFSPEGLLSVNNILANVTEDINEFDFRNMSRGWFIDKIHGALEELSFDTMFVEQFEDFAFPTDSLKLSLPKNAFNLIQVFLYNGTSGSPSGSAVKVWWKRGMHSVHGKDYSSVIRSGVDPIFGHQVSTEVDSSLFCGSNSGVIDFSPSCRAYAFVRLVYNGSYSPFGEVPFIPPILKTYVETFVVERFFRVMKGRDYKKYVNMWKEARVILSEAYREALVRTSRLDKKFADDIRQYVANYNTNNMA